MKILKYLYSLYVLNLTYKLDEKAKVASIYKNKPLTMLSREEEEKIQQIMSHFSNLGYFVLIKGR